jgi:hypothetical protein
MRKHTPAPWRIEGQDIYGNDKNGYICTWSGSRSDAYLIAAAPDMLDALERIARYFIEDSAQAIIIDSAIKKARGE